MIFSSVQQTRPCCCTVCARKHKRINEIRTGKENCDSSGASAPTKLKSTTLFVHFICPGDEMTNTNMEKRGDDTNAENLPMIFNFSGARGAHQIRRPHRHSRREKVLSQVETKVHGAEARDVSGQPITSHLERHVTYTSRNSGACPSAITLLSCRQEAGSAAGPLAAQRYDFLLRFRFYKLKFLRKQSLSVHILGRS